MTKTKRSAQGQNGPTVCITGMGILISVVIGLQVAHANRLLAVQIGTAGRSATSTSAPVQAGQTAVLRSFTEPIEKSIVASTENGVVKHAVVREGEQVRAGDVLAELNHDVLAQTKRQAVARAKSTAAVDAAKSRFELVKSQKKTLESLIQQGHVNQFELQQKTTEYNNALAEYRQAKDERQLNRIEVDRIEAQIQQRIIKSPIDGIVIKLHKRLGEQVSTNEPQYATVVRIDQLKARFYLSARRLNQVSPGDTVAIEVGEHRSRHPATVSYVSPIIDPDSGTGRIEVVIDNTDNQIQSGVVCFWPTARRSGHDHPRRANLSGGRKSTQKDSFNKTHRR